MIEIAVAPKFGPIVTEKARYKAAHGGRGSSKSWGFARYVLARMMGGARALCVREILKTIKDSAKQLLEDQIRILRLPGFSITQSEIKHESGGRIAFIGVRDHSSEGPKSFEGFDILWVMEGQTISERSLEALTPTFRKDGAELLFEWNPRFPSDPVDRLFRGPEGPPPSSIVIEMNHDDNPWFPEALRLDMEAMYQRDPERAKHVWGGAYLTGAGSFFAGVWEQARHVIEPFKIPARWRVDRSHDWGSASPHATVWWAEADGSEVEIAPGIEYAFKRGTLFAVAEDYGTAGDRAYGFNRGTRETAREIAQRIRRIDEQLEGRWPGVRIQPGPADNQIFSANPGARTIAQDYEAGGVRFVKADKSAGSRVSGAVKLRDRLWASREWADTGLMEEPGLFVFDGCRHLARCFGEIQVDEGDPDTYDTDGEDHLIDAARYRALDKSRAGKIKELAL